MARKEVDLSAITYLPGGRSTDGKPMWYVYPGPGELLDADELELLEPDHRTTPPRVAPLRLTEYGKPMARTWRKS